MKLDSSKVPTACAHLIPFAERWGIGDDVEREMKIEEARRDELQALVDAVMAMPDDSMFDWLGGPESYSQNPTVEYVAFTCLTMAYDSARVMLKTMTTPNQASQPIAGKLGSG